MSRTVIRSSLCLLLGAAAFLAGCERPPVDVVQRGYRGTGMERHPRLAMKWLRMAAGHGHEEARAFLERIERGGKLN